MKSAAAARMRLRVQRIEGPAFGRAGEVVAWLGAMQAQDYLGALWAVGLRMADARESDVEAALADRTIVRTWPLRGTLHFVAAADVRWMLELLAPRVIARAASRFRALGLDAATVAKARRIAASALRDGPVSRPALYQALERGRVSTGGQRGLHLLWRLAHEGLVCFGPRQGRQQTLVLLDAWLPSTPRVPRDEALSRLALRYFQGHGPATEADLAWWGGLTLTEARHAMHLAGAALEPVDVEGRRHWVVGATPRVSAGSRAHLLPGFDELLVGYADRSAAIEPAHHARIRGGAGLLSPTIVVEGLVVGTWRRTLAPSRGEVLVAPAPFSPLGPRQARAVGLALERYARFLGARPGERRFTGR